SESASCPCHPPWQSCQCDGLSHSRVWRGRYSNRFNLMDARERIVDALMRDYGNSLLKREMTSGVLPLKLGEAEPATRDSYSYVPPFRAWWDRLGIDPRIYDERLPLK